MRTILGFGFKMNRWNLSIKICLLSILTTLYSCSNHAEVKGSNTRTDREIYRQFVNMAISLDELKFTLDLKKNEYSDTELITEIEDSLILLNKQLVDFIGNEFVNRKTFNFPTNEIVKETSIKVVFSEDKKLCSIAWNTGLGGTMDQHVLICQFLKKGHSIASKVLYDAATAQCELKYNCLPYTIGKIDNNNVYFLIGDNKFESNTNGQSMFFMAIHSGELEEINVLKQKKYASNYFMLSRDFINNSYTIETEKEVLFKEKNIQDISKVHIATSYDNFKRFNILVRADQRTKQLWKI